MEDAWQEFAVDGVGVKGGVAEVGASSHPDKVSTGNPEKNWLPRSSFRSLKAVPTNGTTISSTTA